MPRLHSNPYTRQDAFIELAHGHLSVGVEVLPRFRRDYGFVDDSRRLLETSPLRTRILGRVETRLTSSSILFLVA